MKTPLQFLAFLMLFTMSTANAAPAEEAGAAQPASAFVSCPDPGPDVTVIDLISPDQERPFTGKRHVLAFKVPAGATSATITEERRASRIAEDFASILQGIATRVAGTEQCVLHAQQFPCSYISVAFKNEADKVVLVRKIAAGPEEHWYLSADMPVTNVKQLTYNSASRSVREKEKPASFYLSLNWRIGDLLTEQPHWSPNNLSFKLMAKASTHPNESLGLGFGYSYEAIDFFVARIWTQDAENVPGRGLGATGQFVLGVSFNISKAIGWLSKK